MMKTAIGGQPADLDLDPRVELELVLRLEVLVDPSANARRARQQQGERRHRGEQQADESPVRRAFMDAGSPSRTGAGSSAW
jgi:hypothetical protein